MKKLISILISVISIYSATAQKYTDQYIKDANEVAENWLSDINNKEYDNAYNLLTKEVKQQSAKEEWVRLITELMNEFGEIKERTMITTSFQSSSEGLEDGFYVSIEYSSNYKNTIKHEEYLVLKQNDKAKWEIINYNYNYKNKE